jgi:actin-related protein
LAGRDITQYLLKLLKDRGQVLSTAADFEIVRGIKENLGFLALDFDLALNNSYQNKDVDATY